MEDSKRSLLNDINWFQNLHIESPLIIGGDFNMISNLEETKEASTPSVPKILPSKIPSPPVH